MKNTEIREFSDKELVERIENEKTLLLKQKLNHAVSPLDNPNKIKESRKNVARMLTEKRKRELEQLK